MEQITIPYISSDIHGEIPNNKRNGLLSKDHSFHDWYRFVLSFPPTLVRAYIDKFKVGSTQKVLDPFCGTGTTNIECKLNGIPSIGIESNPFPFFASKVKVNWQIDPIKLIENSSLIAEKANEELRKTGIYDEVLHIESGNEELFTLSPEKEKLLIKDSLSPLPKHKSIILLSCIQKYGEPDLLGHLKLAFAKTLVFDSSNLAFGPEVGVGKIKNDCPVVANWVKEIRAISSDIQRFGNNQTRADMYQLDSRDLSWQVEPQSIDCVITSPPYPNEKDYTRTTRLESVFLGFINDSEDLRAVKKSLLRSNTRGIYKNDADYLEVADIPEIVELTERIEGKRIELGKTSGFEKQYSKVTKNYFGGMALHFKELRSILKPGATLAYVVGDQASYFRILIKTGQLLGKVAEKYGYEVIGLDLFRTRLSTATREQLREEVLLLKWKS